MGLKKSTGNGKYIKEYDYDTVLPFGKNKGLTVSEVIDDGECSLIMYYINNKIITASNDLYMGMMSKCEGGCESCSYQF